MTTLSNIPALAASRQLNISKAGLSQAITRLTTGRRVNSAYDDASALAAGNTAQASSRSSAAQVTGDQAAYFTAMANLATYTGNPDTEAAAASTALYNTQLHGITSENQLGVSDAYLGADIGAEMANMTKYQILMQSGTSALSAANQATQSILALFR